MRKKYAKDEDNFFDTELILMLSYADTGDFKQGEIRTLTCGVNKYTLADLQNGKWNGKIPVVDPHHCDIGIDRNKRYHIYYADKWVRV